MRSIKMSEKNSRLCKCGSLADFIKDYWVTEMKSKKDEYESSLMIPKEKVCGIIRRRYCKKCLSKLARKRYFDDRRLNSIIIASALAPFLVAIIKFIIDIFFFSATDAVFPLVLSSVAGVAVFFVLYFKLGAEQKKRKRIIAGDFEDKVFVYSFIDSYAAYDSWKAVRDIPSVDIVVDGSGRANTELERQGFFMKVAYEDKVNVEAMEERLKFDFNDEAEYLKRTYVNAGFLSDIR
jgi:hypothetical protein